MNSQNIGISWQLTDRHGWGIFGYNLVINLIHNGPLPPALLTEPNFIGIPEETTNKIRSYIIPENTLPSALERTTLLHSLGNGFKENPSTQNIRGRKNIAFSFFEESKFAPSSISKAKSWDYMLVGSTWNKRVCLAHGIINTAFVSQGVDTEHFAPAPRHGTPSGRFVVFSGGKLEYRKGQDLVLTAFRKFHERHPDSLLVTAWQNNWLDSAITIANSPLLTAAPEIDANGHIKIAEWAVANGVPANAFIDLGWVSNARLPAILNEADIAIFPSRCEGGTNLSAMETMACGIPCILSSNTGHLDIIEDAKNCYPLLHQTTAETGPRSDWRNSDVDEIVDHLETAYQHADDRKQRGRAATASMAHLSWQNQTRKLTDHIRPFL